jgi:acyl-CoA synthetase (AMP-forming)/AMP-acid ligase II
VGAAVCGNAVAVLRADGTLAEPGEVGEVCMRGHNVMLGYDGNPEETTRCFSGGWFHSGDMGVWAEKSHHVPRLLTLVGRSKNIIKVGGEAVSLEELDRLILEIPGVLDAASVAIGDSTYGERPACIVHVSESAITPSVIRDALSKRLSQQKLPLRIEFVANVPRTANGKIIRSAIKAQYFED